MSHNVERHEKKMYLQTCVCRKKKENALSGIDLGPCSISKTCSPEEDTLQLIKYKHIQFCIPPPPPRASLYLLNNEAKNVGIEFAGTKRLGSWPISLQPNSVPR